MIKAIKILIFTEGTIIMHKIAVGHSRKEIVKQVEKKHQSVHDYFSYVPIGNAAKKLSAWKKQGAKILYLTSRRMSAEINQIKIVLKRNDFPNGKLFFREKNEEYKNIAERIAPDILIEDDCESIGGINEMTFTKITPLVKKRIKSVVVKEFGGIDCLPDSVVDLVDMK